MASFQIKRVNALPGVLEASTMYIVKSADAGLADIYVTGTVNTEVRHLIGKTEIETLVTDAVSASVSGAPLLAANIAARDALILTSNALILVLDASADATVNAGAALYFYDQVGDTFHKVSEYESMDTVLTWGSITDGPTSSPAQVDTAVSYSHTHTNSAALAKIGEDIQGNITYNSQPIPVTLAVSEW